MKPWSRQTLLKGEKIPTVQEILTIAEEIENEKIRCLFVLTYLTAGRMRELVRSRILKTVYETAEGKVIEKKTKRAVKSRKIFTGVVRASLRRNDLKMVSVKGRKIFLIDLRNQKNRNKLRKKIPVPLDIPENYKLLECILEYLNELDRDEEVFPISYQYAYKVLNKYWNPHWMRHIRLTHLVTNYGYKEEQLKLYAGWSDTRPAKNYIEMRWEDLMYKKQEQ